MLYQYYSKPHYNVKKEVIKTGDKHITIRMDEELYQQVKIYCVTNKVTVKDLITELVKKLLPEPEK